MDTGAAPLPDYYEAESIGNNWALWCKKCDKGWKLPKSNNHPAPILKLLEHARSHEPVLRPAGWVSAGNTSQRLYSGSLSRHFQVF